MLIEYSNVPSLNKFWNRYSFKIFYSIGLSIFNLFITKFLNYFFEKVLPKVLDILKIDIYFLCKNFYNGAKHLEG